MTNATAAMGTSASDREAALEKEMAQSRHLTAVDARLIELDADLRVSKHAKFWGKRIARARRKLCNYTDNSWSLKEDDDGHYLAALRRWLGPLFKVEVYRPQDMARDLVRISW